MNSMMYYGGFFLSIVFLILAVLFFFVFKVPSIHRYFKYNSREGLVEAEKVTGEKHKKNQGPKKVTQEEYDNLTQVITLSKSETDRIDPERTDFLDTEQINTKTVEKIEQVATETEVL